jgi:hypothetical protein
VDVAEALADAERVAVFVVTAAAAGAAAVSSSATTSNDATARRCLSCDITWPQLSENINQRMEHGHGGRVSHHTVAPTWPVSSVGGLKVIEVGAVGAVAPTSCRERRRAPLRLSYYSGRPSLDCLALIAR